jgi:hypothetical protein
MEQSQVDTLEIYNTLSTITEVQSLNHPSPKKVTKEYEKGNTSQ